MTYPQTALSTPLSIPILGLNKRDPLAAMPQGFATEILNFEPEAQYLKLRKGYVRHGDTGDTADVLRGLGRHEVTNGTLYAVGVDATTPAKSVLWRVESNGTLTNLGTVGSAAPSTRLTSSFPYYSGNRLSFTPMSIGTDDVLYDGAAITGTGFTNAATALGLVYAACTYNGRVYFFAQGPSGMGLYYSSTVGGITGSMGYLDTRAFLESGSYCSWMGVLSSPSGVASESFICLGGYNGEVIVYSGDYPEASNWQIAGRFKIAPPICQSPPLVIDSDLWIPTKIGVTSIRSLFTNSESNPENHLISRNITDYWVRTIREAVEYDGFEDLNPEACSSAYWPERNQAYFLIQGFLASDGTYSNRNTAATMFVYNLTSKAWTYHKIDNIKNTGVQGSGAGARSLIYFKNNIYFLTGNTVMKMSDSVYKDETWNSANTFTEYPYELHSAYTALNASSIRKRVTGVDLLIKTDFDGSNVGVQIASDFGRKVSSTSNQSLQDGHNNVTYNVGVDGTYLQYRLTGTSDSASTDGLELYSVGLNIK